MLYHDLYQDKLLHVGRQAISPIMQDHWGQWAFIMFAYFVVPFLITDYWMHAVLLPFLIYSIAAMGMNILAGYCGQFSLSSGAFIVMGAFLADKVMLFFPEFNLIFVVFLAAGITAVIGLICGLVSLRIQGLYFLLATLGVQFFLMWLLVRAGWEHQIALKTFILEPEYMIFGIALNGTEASLVGKYLLCLVMLTIMIVIAKTLLCGRFGWMWMVVRDMGDMAELMGVRLWCAKLSAFFISSFYFGISGALMLFLWSDMVRIGPLFGISQSILILFMVIIGGLGSLFGTFLGTAFFIIMPLILKNIMIEFFATTAESAEYMRIMVIGIFVIIMLIVEPMGLYQLWQNAREKLKSWPFPRAS